MNKNTIYYKPGAKMLALSKHNKKYYQEIGDISRLITPTQEKTFYSKIKQIPEIAIFFILFVLFQIFMSLFKL